MKRLHMPLSSYRTLGSSVLNPTRTSELLRHIRRVIKETTTPSWLGTVPYDFGDPKAGKMKADEWKTLCTVYLPLALVSKWGEGSLHSDVDQAVCCKQLLDHTMELVSAVWISLRRATSEEEIEKYERYIKNYIAGLRNIHPNVTPTANLHMATHIGDFMRLFGPVYSWWCFPFERLIGFVQRMPNNKKWG